VRDAPGVLREALIGPRVEGSGRGRWLAERKLMVVRYQEEASYGKGEEDEEVVGRAKKWLLSGLPMLPGQERKKGAVSRDEPKGQKMKRNLKVTYGLQGNIGRIEMGREKKNRIFKPSLNWVQNRIKSNQLFGTFSNLEIWNFI
jgi:hypothetical protein